MKNILVIRRDNIGDLVCTTPLIEGIKTALPEANIYLIINTVSQGVVLNNPHITQIFTYCKAKHTAGTFSKLRVYADRAKMFMQLRRIQFDAAILANPSPCKYSLRLAKMAGAKHIIGADTGDKGINVPFSRNDFRGEHQVEQTFSYLSAITNQKIAIPPVRIWLTEQEREDASQRINRLQKGKKIGLAVHISSRSAKRRWPLDRYAEVIQRFLEENPLDSVLIFWSPQGTLAPDDIGDRHRADQLLTACNSSRVSLYPTASVRELAAAYEHCEQVLCSDGGQMHLAAAMHKKQAVLFGDTDHKAWHPWSGQYLILQTPGGECLDISVEDAWHALNRLKEPVDYPAPDTAGR